MRFEHLFLYSAQQTFDTIQKYGYQLVFHSFTALCLPS